jgi:hypothetical protein
LFTPEAKAHCFRVGLGEQYFRSRPS